MSNLVQAFDAPFNSSAPGYADWEKYQKPKVSGVTLMYPWNSVETSKGVYDFTEIDKRLGSFPGMKIAVVFAPQTLYTGANYVPDYVDSAVPSNQRASCDGVSSIAPWNPVFSTAWRNFASAAITHYNLPTTPKLAYARFGYFRGGQASLQCVPQLEALAGGASQLKPLWLENYQSLVYAITDSRPEFPVQLEVAYGPQTDVSYPTAEANFCVSNGIGIGDGGFSPEDLTSKNPSSDWVSLFSTYRLRSIIRELQPLTTGLNLTTMIPYAKANYCNVLELQMDYLNKAFNPGGDSAWASAITEFLT